MVGRYFDARSTKRDRKSEPRRTSANNQHTCFFHRMDGKGGSVWKDSLRSTISHLPSRFCVCQSLT
jgi:hypothetical protein